MLTPSSKKRDRDFNNINSPNKKLRTYSTGPTNIYNSPQTTNKTPKTSSITPLLNNLTCRPTLSRSLITITHRNIANDINNIQKCNSCGQTGHSSKAYQLCPQHAVSTICHETITCSSCGLSGHATKANSKCPNKQFIKELSTATCGSCGLSGHATKANSKCPNKQVIKKPTTATCGSCGLSGHATKANSKCLNNTNTQICSSCQFMGHQSEFSKYCKNFIDNTSKRCGHCKSTTHLRKTHGDCTYNIKTTKANVNIV